MERTEHQQRQQKTRSEECDRANTIHTTQNEEYVCVCLSMFVCERLFVRRKKCDNDNNAQKQTLKDREKERNKYYKLINEAKRKKNVL